MSRYRGVTNALGFGSRIMIGAISNNTLLAAILGPGVARVRGGEAGRGGPKPVAGDKVDPGLDRVELSSAATLASRSEADTGDVAALGGSEQQESQKLRKRDAEVRRHEAAHKGAAGQYAKGGAKFEYESGPNGKQYAVGGEVSIDTSEIAGDPQATIQKMQQVRRAALAPANPSGQDRAVAASAAKLEQKARAEISDKKRNGGGSESSSPYSNSGKAEELTRGLLLSTVA